MIHRQDADPGRGSQAAGHQLEAGHGQSLYQATVQAPRDVTRKRAFFTSGNQIESLEDIGLAELAEELESLKHNEVHVSDTLPESLTSTRNGTMASAPGSPERQPEGDREFWTVERELIVKNGEYLASILTSAYAPKMR